MSGQAGMRVDWRALWASGDLFRFCFVSLGILLHATNETMIATIMPAMVGDLSGVELVGWSLAVYELGAISAGAAAGRLVSYVPLRTNMVVAALFYAAGALICAAAPSMPVFLLGRLIEGLGGGALVSLAFVSVERLFQRAIWPQLFAIISAIWGVAAFTGPLFGAVVAEALSWRWAFGLFSVAGFAMAAASFLVLTGSATTVDRRGEAAPPPFPFTPLACLALAVTLIASAGVSIELVRSSVLLVAWPGRSRAVLQARRAIARGAAVPVKTVRLAQQGRQRHDHDRRLFGRDLLLHHLWAADPHQPARHPGAHHRLHHRAEFDRLVGPVDPRRRRAAAARAG